MTDLWQAHVPDELVFQALLETALGVFMLAWSLNHRTGAWALASIGGAAVFFVIDSIYFAAYALPAWFGVRSEFSNWFFFHASTLWWPRMVALGLFVVANTLGRRVLPSELTGT